jgi:taurine---2-oxoglutarate transaminase
MFSLLTVAQMQLKMLYVWQEFTPRRHKVLSFYRSYHGNTGTAIQMTGDPRRWPNEFAYGVIHFFGPFPYRSQFWSNSPEQETERALQHLESVIQFEGPATIAAICIETVVGTAGLWHQLLDILKV